MTLRITSCDPSPPPPPGSPSYDLTFLEAFDVTPPEPIDWRDNDQWPVGDQEESGACVGWAVGNGLLNWWFRKKGWMPSTDRISPRFLWLAAIATTESDAAFQLPAIINETQATTIKNALDVAAKFGCLKEPDATAQIWHGPPLPSDGSPIDALVVREPRVKWLGVDKLVWARWLVQEGPIVVRMDIDFKFDVAKPGASSRLFDYGGRTGRGHAVVIVGRQANGDFIIRNSWGEAWGEEGFALADPVYLFGHAGRPGAVTEAWGVYSSI